MELCKGCAFTYCLLALLPAGTDILLGGNADYMARLKLREMLMPEVVSQGG
jgi:hypothetical protein